MADLDEQLLVEQQRTLDFSLAASTIVLNLIGEISRQLIEPLAGMDPELLDEAETAAAYAAAHDAAIRLKETIRFALLVHAEIEEAAGIDTKENS